MSGEYERDLRGMSLAQAADLLKKKEISSVGLTELTLDLARLNKHNAYVHINDKAYSQAEQADQRRGGGKPLSLIDGVPMALMDNICVEGMPMTCASKTLEAFIPPYTATIAERLEAAGSVLLGKLNMDEFAASDNGSSLFGPSRNPFDHSRGAGGASGGPAASVAEGSAFFALGIDAGGGVRLPAALCGVVGLKPTYGRVSRYGMTAFASSMDQPGIVCGTVEDCAIVLSIIAGRDSKDACSLRSAAPDYRAELAGLDGLKGLRVGVPTEYLGPMIQDDQRRSVQDAIARLRDNGAEVEECSLPHTAYAPGAYFVISSAEFNSNMNRYDGVKFGYRAKDYEGYEDMLLKTRAQAFGDEVKRRVLFGVYAVSGGRFNSVYMKAARVRTLVIEDFRRAFGKYDLLLTPSAAGLAPRIGDSSDAGAGKDLGKDLNYCFAGSGLAGLPALSLPWGADKEGLPVGIQLIGPALSEDLLLKAAHGLEASRR